MANNNNTLQVGSKIKPIPVQPTEIGIDTNSSLINNILDAYDSSTLDTTALENFTTISQSREQIYQLLDSMANDDRVASVLETYAEDVCEPNDRGEIIWCDSADEDVARYVSFLLDSMNVDKHIYKWAYALIKYGDVYVRLFKQSDYNDDKIFNNSKVAARAKLHEATGSDLYDSEGLAIEDSNALRENINVNYHASYDHYVDYVEAVPNPGEMYELTRFGKTMGYIKAPTSVINSQFDQVAESAPGVASYTNFKMKTNDVDIFQATDFAHASLEDNSPRVPEEVSIYTNDDDYNASSNASVYTVKRGQSLLYSVFRVWRELTLLENSIILNRLTKASTVRIIEVEVGDMPKDKVKSTLAQIKAMVEQKSALNVDKGMSEYTNPGPVENTIYVPTKGELGKITTQELGSDSADPKSLADLDYFLNKYYASLRVPKQFFAQTDDGAGFNGGSSLSIISSRYGKAVKRIQNALIQMITDIINLKLIDKGQDSYVNKFTIRMQAPMTQEMLDRREATNNEIGVIRDIMQIIGDNVDDPIRKLEALKVLLSSSSQDSQLISLIQDEIDALESSDSEGSSSEGAGDESLRPHDMEPIRFDNVEDIDGEAPSLEPASYEDEGPTMEEPSLEDIPSNDEELPSFMDMGIEDAVNLRNN